MPGQIWGLATLESTGPVFVTSYDGCDLDATVLTAVDPAGDVIWRRSFEGHPRPPRVTPVGTVWLADQGPAGYVFIEVDPEGQVRGAVVPEHQAREHLGAFVVVPEGFYAIWLPASPGRQPPPGHAPRIARHSQTGSTVWSTPLALGALSFPGVVEAGVDTDWQIRPMKPWQARTISVDHREPLLVSANRVLVGIGDASSGIGVCTILDTATGRIVATTPPGPYHHKAIAGPGSFLIGQQGYGAFTTMLYDPAGHTPQTWRSHGMMLACSGAIANSRRSPRTSNTRRCTPTTTTEPS